MITHALRLLAAHPEQREHLLADVEGRVGATVEDVVRPAPRSHNAVGGVPEPCSGSDVRGGGPGRCPSTDRPGCSR